MMWHDVATYVTKVGVHTLTNICFHCKLESLPIYQLWCNCLFNPNWLWPSKNTVWETKLNFLISGKRVAYLFIYYNSVFQSMFYRTFDTFKNFQKLKSCLMVTFTINRVKRGKSPSRFIPGSTWCIFLSF